MRTRTLGTEGLPGLRAAAGPSRSSRAPRRRSVTSHRVASRRAYGYPTSLYLAVDGDQVRMDKARRDVHPYMSPHFWSDLAANPPAGYANPVSLTEYWSTVTETGTWGDPTSATKEKGQRVLAAAADELLEVIREFRARPIRPRAPFQNPDVQERNQHLHGPIPRFTS
jgi:hypothetical protein